MRIKIFVLLMLVLLVACQKQQIPDTAKEGESLLLRALLIRSHDPDDNGTTIICFCNSTYYEESGKCEIKDFFKMTKKEKEPTLVCLHHIGGLI